jgi:hypothetical protein
MSQHRCLRKMTDSHHEFGLGRQEHPIPSRVEMLNQGGSPGGVAEASYSQVAGSDNPNAAWPLTARCYSSISPDVTFATR